MSKTHSSGELDGAPPTPPPPDPPPSFACIDCGSCSYSDISKVNVTVYPITFGEVVGVCTLSQVAVKRTYDFYADMSPDYVEWRYDANNYIRRRCSTNKWELTTDQDIDAVTDVGACVSSTSTPPLELHTCSKYTRWLTVFGNALFNYFNQV